MDERILTAWQTAAKMTWRAIKVTAKGIYKALDSEIAEKFFEKTSLLVFIGGAVAVSVLASLGLFLAEVEITGMKAYGTMATAIWIAQAAVFAVPLGMWTVRFWRWMF